ncbi:MAG: SIS domain-containing protein [Candidatus Liptonbacteria bacterium]
MFNQRVDETIAALSNLKDKHIKEKISRVVDLIGEALMSRHKLLIAGNGGSAAQAQHLSAEIVATLHKEKRRGYPAISLTTDTSYLTAWLNDFGKSDLDGIFARQVEALGQPGDVFLGISTSGNSQNIIQAARKAKELGMKTVGLLGCGGGVIKKECDVSVVIPSNSTATIQEAQTLVVHFICEQIVPKLK